MRDSRGGAWFSRRTSDVALPVKLTRSAIEDWLFKLCPVFEHPEADIYLVPVSPELGVKLSLKRRVLRSDSAQVDEFESSCVIGIARRRDAKLVVPAMEYATTSGSLLYSGTSWDPSWRACVQGWVRVLFAKEPTYKQLAAVEAEPDSTQADYPWPPRSPALFARQLEELRKWTKRRRPPLWALSFTASVSESLQSGQALSERLELMLLLQLHGNAGH